MSGAAPHPRQGLVASAQAVLKSLAPGGAPCELPMAVGAPDFVREAS